MRVHYIDAALQEHYHGGTQVQYSSDMPIAALPSCFSSLLSTFRPLQAIFGYSKHFSAMPSSFQLCWTLFCFDNHFSSVLSTSRLVKHFPALLSTFATRHFSSILSVFSALLSFFLLRWTFFCPTKHFADICRMCFLLCQAFFFYAAQYTAKQKKTRRTEKKKHLA